MLLISAHQLSSKLIRKLNVLLLTLGFVLSPLYRPSFDPFCRRTPSVLSLLHTLSFVHLPLACVQPSRSPQKNRGGSGTAVHRLLPPMYYTFNCLGAISNTWRSLSLRFAQTKKNGALLLTEFLDLEKRKPTEEYKPENICTRILWSVVLKLTINY